MHPMMDQQQFENLLSQLMTHVSQLENDKLISEQWAVTLESQNQSMEVLIQNHTMLLNAANTQAQQHAQQLTTLLQEIQDLRICPARSNTEIKINKPDIFN